MKKLLTILLLLPLLGQATIYTWPTSNGNINVTNANIGATLAAGDIVDIPFKAGGYRSFSFSGIGSTSMLVTDTIRIVFQGGAFITPGGPNFANSMDASYHIKIENWIMNDNIDVAFTSYASTNYSWYITFFNCTFRGMNGFFPSSPQSFSLPAFSGDTTKCFKNWAWINCTWDSLVGANSGNTALWIGGIQTNQVWLNPLIKNCRMAHYSSSGGPSCYVNGLNCYNLVMINDTLEQLGMNVINPSGHAASCILQDAWITITGCYFGKDNFGTDIRIFMNADLPNVPGYQGRSRIYNNLIVDKRKYAFVESRSTYGDTITLPYTRRRASPEISNNTMYNMAVGAGLNPPSAYKTAAGEYYDTNDSVAMWNNVLTGLRDTTPTVPDGPLLVTFSGSGGLGFQDTASNILSLAWSTSGLADSLSFYPALNGPAYNSGIATKAYITTDYHGIARPTLFRQPFGLNHGVDIGASQLPLLSILKAMRGGFIHWH